MFFSFFFASSCVADNSLGRAKKYIEVSGRPGTAQFISPPYGRSKDTYNLTWTIESVPPLDEIRLLYRKLIVSYTPLYTSCINFLTNFHVSNVSDPTRAG